MARCICSVCRQPFDSDDSPAMPFCSERCRLIDLGRWFDEGYSLPIERSRELDEFQDEEQGED
jgi:endogenous inhibitor of DNA gyrase (YacG/DUF329 family)